MRDKKRISRILNKLKRVWMACPELRLGQLIINWGEGYKIDTYYLEDNLIEEQLDIWIKTNNIK